MASVCFYLIYLCILCCTPFIKAEEKKGPILTPSVSIDPFLYIVKRTDPSDLSLSLSDEDIKNAQEILSQNKGVTRVYQKLASFAICALSNDLDHALMLKVVKSENSNYVKEVSGIDQIAMYNAATGHKIRSMLIVKPAGWTVNPNAFGNSSADGTPSKGVPFMVGGPVFSGDSYSVHLQSNDDRSLNRPITLMNLALDSYGMVNHYGFNVNLSEKDVDVEIVEGGRSIKLRGCQGYSDSSDTRTLTDMSITFDLYMNSHDLATATSGQYKMQYSMYWADSNDLSNSTTVYGIRSSS